MIRQPIRDFGRHCLWGWAVLALGLTVGLARPAAAGQIRVAIQGEIAIMSGELDGSIRPGDRFRGVYTIDTEAVDELPETQQLGQYRLGPRVAPHSTLGIRLRMGNYVLATNLSNPAGS